MTRQFFLSLVALAGLWFPALAEDDIVMGETFTLQSRLLAEEQTYAVALPAGYDRERAYPVVYLLDGYETQFQAVSSLARALNGMASSMPQVIIVALPSNNRIRDYLPSENREDAKGEEMAWLLDAGGGEMYLRVLEEEVFPHIEKAYRTMPYRMVIGHSAGGTLALYDLMSGNAAFNAYMVIDPPVTMQGHYLVTLAEQMTTLKDPSRVLYLSYVPHSDGSGHEDAVRGILSRIKARMPADFRGRDQLFEQETHQSVQVESYLRGFQMIFEGYKPPGIEEAAHTPSTLLDHYKDYSARMGVCFPPDLAYTNIVAYNALNYYGLKEQAKVLFEVNIKNYPNSPSAWSGMGDYHIAVGDAAAARRAFIHALELDPAFAYAQTRLEGLDAE